MLSDEAYYLNATTKNKKRQQELYLKTELSGKTSQADIKKKLGKYGNQTNLKQRERKAK